MRLYYQSHLLQMRGLKQLTKAQAEYTSESHLLQMRGLKPKSEHTLQIPAIVASFTDAWIETLILFMYLIPIMSHLLQMRGLKPFARK